ncbi:MAG: hypothetical protein IPL16_10460 [Ignavibacteria bacterium]|nr:hypothetical protein [Ignavibacteria bacterium]
MAKNKYYCFVAGWGKFLRTDFTQRLRISFVDEISTFLRNIALHGTPENYIEKLTNKLYEEQITDLLVEKLLDENIEDVFNFFWNLKTLDEQLFNIYFNDYYSKTELEFEPLKTERTRTVFLFVFLIYCYSDEVNSKTLLNNKSDIDSHIRKVITSNSFGDKVFLSALSEIFDFTNEHPL